MQPSGSRSSTSAVSTSRSDIPKHVRDEQRRLRNIESAKRSRVRRQEQERKVELQIFENDRRIRHLERQIEDLTNDLKSPSHMNSLQQNAGQLPASTHGSPPNLEQQSPENRVEPQEHFSKSNDVE